MPKYIAIAAVTIDGKIAKDPKHFSDWTSPEDKIFMRALLDKCDVIIVGNNTYKTAKKPLSKRNCIVFTSQVTSTLRKNDNLLYCNPKKVNLKKLIAKFKYRRVAILGGAQTYTYCLENGMLDELYLTIEPIVFGKGIDLFTSKNSLDSKFKLISVKKLNSQGSLLLRYKK
jgi:dihydrofolate reductase